jgi:opacity protein-like surface antigen
MKRSWLVISALLGWLLVDATPAGAQTDEDTGEVSAYGGLGFGSLGSHGSAGAASGIEISKYALGVIDASFMPLGTHTLRPTSGAASKSRLYDFNFTVHFQVPPHHGWAPYVLMGGGVLLDFYHVTRTGPDGTIYDRGRNDGRFGFETGAGVRYYLRDHWGLKAEYRCTVSSENFSRILFGVFYRFEGPWPFLAARTGRGGRRIPE